MGGQFNRGVKIASIERLVERHSGRMVSGVLVRNLTACPRWGKLSGYRPKEGIMVEEGSGSGMLDDADYSEFLRISGLRIEEIRGDEVRGWIDLDEQHHTPWGVVHGGVYAAAVESAASLGASAAVKDREQFAVGLNNNTDFLRPVTKGRVDVVAEPIMQGKSQQLWQVVITRADDGKEVARGQVRLQNVSRS